MIDIVSHPSPSTPDMGIADTQAPRAANILSVQMGWLYYAPPDFGVDLAYFLNPAFSFQDAAFKAYLVQVLANFAISVAEVTETVETLYQKYAFNLTPSQNDGSLITR
jgi:hypothetical protein